MTNEIEKITDGPIVKTIFSLAIPVVLGMFMEFALTTTDYYWVSKLGSTAQDAVTSSMVVIWTVFSSITLVSVGLTAIIARHVGARDYNMASYFIKQGFVLAIILGLVISISGFLATKKLLIFMGTESETLSMANPYLKISFAASILFFIADTAYAVFRASGDTKTPTKVSILTVIINILLDPLLIFGYGPIPAYGVKGASIATAISIFICSIIIIAKLFRNGLEYKIVDFSKVRAKFSDMLKIMRISLPITSQQLIFSFVYWFLIKIVHEYGEEAAAAMGIGNRMESFSYLTCYGFSLAASTMVGQNLGAQKPQRAAKCAWGATGLAVCMTFIISIFFIGTPRAIASVFSDNPAVLKIAVDYLIILGLSQMAMAIEIVLEGSFGGAGDTLPPMIVQIPLSLLRIPMAYYFCFNLDWGINGVWWTLTITSIMKATILAILFKKGNWKKKQV